jgi:glycosyltransferase involved in cell wall biosynthesis
MATRTPSVSVVLPTYQRRGLVERAIASVLAQTHRDFELIVIDDGSTDGTEEALASFGDALRYRWQPNRGVSAARNAGIELARAPVVAFIDSDNQWLPDHLAVVTAVLERHPEAVLASTCRECIAAGAQEPDDAELRDVLPNLLLRNDVGLISCAAARREAVLAAGGFDERLSVAEDSELWLRLAMRGPFAFVRRRTVIPQATVGGLRERGGRLGGYLEAWEVGWPRIISELERLERDDRDLLVARAEGNHHLVKAIRALDRRDDSAVRFELEQACRRSPELSSHPLGVSHRLRRYSPRWDDPAERLRFYETVITLWPERHADAVLYLRARAALFALGRGRPAAAARLLRGWSIRATPGFLVRTSPDITQRFRRSVQDYRNRGGESRLLAEPAS